jgi:hypothetical protein
MHPPGPTCRGVARYASTLPGTPPPGCGRVPFAARFIHPLGAPADEIKEKKTISIDSYRPWVPLVNDVCFSQLVAPRGHPGGGSETKWSEGETSPTR